MVGAGGTVLFLVPSISLLSQTLREWMQESTVELRPFAVCSDVRVGRKQTEDMGVVDLAEPATTSADKLLERMGRSTSEGEDDGHLLHLPVDPGGGRGPSRQGSGSSTWWSATRRTARPA